MRFITMRIRILLFLAASAIILMACTRHVRTITFYTPTLNPDGERVAYLKRIAHFIVQKHSLIGQELEFREDRLLLCQALRDLEEEYCIQDWSLPLTKDSAASKGEIFAEILWAGNAVLYQVRLLGFGAVPIGEPGPYRGEGTEHILTNFPAEEPKQTLTRNAKWIARLDKQPEQFAFPINNRIIVEGYQP